MTTHAEIYARLHERRGDWVEERRRARGYQAELAEAQERNLRLAGENARILGIIADHADRNIVGGLVRQALDTIALEIAEGLEG